MFAKILKFNPFHGKDGKFAPATQEHRYGRDMKQQYQWLSSKVKRMKLPSVDHLVEQHPDKFVELASQWRQRHPLH